MFGTSPPNWTPVTPIVYVPVLWNSYNGVWVISNGGRDALSSSGSVYSVHAGAVTKTTGKWYFEMRIVRKDYSYSAAVRHGVGVTRLASPTYDDIRAQGIEYNMAGAINRNGSTVASLGALSAGITAMFALDLDNLRCWVGRNGVWNGDPSAGTSPTVTGVTAGTHKIAAMHESAGSYQNQYRINSEPSQFSYPVPTGFLPWGKLP